MSRILTRSTALVLILLGVATAELLLGGVPRAALLHAAMLLGLATVAFLARRFAWPELVPSLAIVIVLMTLYQSLAEPAFIARGGAYDASLAAVDRLLAFGHDPALAAARVLTPGRLEFFSFVYGLFIPYLWLSILLGCFGRPDDERARFILGLAVTYTIAYLGYLILPSRGPVEYYPFAHALHGGRFHALVLQSVAATGGNHGAFPSLHVAASAYLCAFDLRRHLLRGLTYAPMVALIAVSTIFLRYHYLVDVVTGFAIAALAFVAAERVRA